LSFLRNVEMRSTSASLLRPAVSLALPSDDPRPLVPEVPGFVPDAPPLLLVERRLEPVLSLETVPPALVRLLPVLRPPVLRPPVLRPPALRPVARGADPVDFDAEALEPDVPLAFLDEAEAFDPLDLDLPAADEEPPPLVERAPLVGEAEPVERVEPPPAAERPVPPLVVLLRVVALLAAREEAAFDGALFDAVALFAGEVAFARGVVLFA
jgi:hypothetical protein